MKTKIIKTILLSCFVLLITSLSYAQTTTPVKPVSVKHGVYLGESKPLRDIPPISDEELQVMNERFKTRVLNPKLRYRAYPFAETALPKGLDPALQTIYNKGDRSSNLIQNFNGQTTSSLPPDANGTPGPNHYMQTVNTTYAIYSKAGLLLAGPTNMNLLFGNVPGAQYNHGDPLIQYDEVADRWVAVEFSVPSGNDYMLIAVSTTNDPTGTWHQYSFDVDDMPDYEKLGIWRDGYYMGMNNSSGKDIYVFEREAMLNGEPSPLFIGFDNPWRPVGSDGFMCVPPVDNDGPHAPVGTPGMFIAIKDDAFSGGQDEIWLYELDVNWTTPSNSTFNRIAQIPTDPFDSNFGSSWDNIAQPGVTRKLDAIPQVVMNVPQYRNFGTHQTIVCCHTVDVNGNDRAGIRWYELRNSGSGWSIRQQGTYSPDEHSRWMGSISMNVNKKIALGYSISSSSVYPGIRITGQTSGENQNASGILDFPEVVVQDGSASQTSVNRWGDYSLMAVDPADNETFWFTTQYKQTSTTNHTKITSFKIGNPPVAVTNPPTNITLTSATLNASVNPNTLSTTYQFEWGTTTSYGNVTTIQNAGNGSTPTLVSHNLTGLVTGTEYHYRIKAINIDGTTYGLDASFTPGGAIVVTSPVNGITTNSAIGGGNVTSDGGIPVTQKGICWSTNQNPTLANSFTSEGPGTGIFTSNINGLNSNTVYYVRAYATNSAGTYYGQQVQFTTNCGIFTPPFTEGFSNITIPNCWEIVDNQNNGQVWKFGTMANVTINGNYAYINSDGYGSGNSQNCDLVTPTINTMGFSNLSLKFSSNFKSYSTSKGTVSYSIDNGVTWNLLREFTTTTSNPPELVNINIPQLTNQEQVKFKWNYTGTWAYHWAIDNVELIGVASNVLTVTPQNQNTSYSAGSLNYNVSCSGSWTAISDQSWCTVTSSGTGTGNLTANFTENTGLTQRIANITVSSAGLPDVTVTLTQDGAPLPTLTVTPANHNVTSVAGSVQYQVTTTQAWTAISDQSWCTITPSGNGNGNITANYLENPGQTPRTANITVSSTGLADVIVTLTQQGYDLEFSVTPQNYNVTSDSGNVSFSVVSDENWGITTNNSWSQPQTTSGSGIGDFVINYSENTEITQRISYITVTEANTNDVITVTITQEAALPLLIVFPQQQFIDETGGNVVFEVQSNINWTASSNTNWCSVTPSGSGNGTITANCSVNSSIHERTAEIKVIGENVPDVIVTIIQSGAIPFLNVTPPEVQVSHESGTAIFNVYSNTSWYTESDVTWCTPTNSGQGNGIIQANYTENTSNTVRTANIRVYGDDVSDSNITLIQLGFDDIDDLMSDQIIIYPNPTDGLFVISNSNLEKTNMKITLFDTKGVTVLKQNLSNQSKYSLNIQNFPSGVYYLKIEANNKNVFMKVIKK